MWIQCWPFSQRNLITSVVVCSWCSNTHCCTHDAAGEVRTGKLIELLLLAMGLSFNTICDQICGSIGWCPNFATEICILSRRVPEIFTSKGMFKFKSLGWFLRKYLLVQVIIVSTSFPVYIHQFFPHNTIGISLYHQHMVVLSPSSLPQFPKDASQCADAGTAGTARLRHDAVRVEDNGTMGQCPAGSPRSPSWGMVSVGLPWSTTFHEFYISIYTLYLYIIHNRIFYFCSIFSRKMDRTGYLTSLPELRKVNWIPSKPVVAPLWASKVSLVVGSKVSVKQKRTWAAAWGKSGNGAAYRNLWPFNGEYEYQPVD